MKPICFIGARGGSKGVLRKNVRLLVDRPLIAYTIESAIESGIFQSVIVSTEDKEIASVAKKYGAEVPFVRPKSLATDKASMNNVLLHGIKEMYSLGYKFEIMVNRDCTVPFIKIRDIVGSIKLLKAKKCDLVVGVYRQHHNPYFNMMERGPGGFLKFSKTLSKQVVRREDAPIVYQLNGLFAFYARKFLKYGKLYMPKTLPYEISPESGIMIDTEFEFKVAELMAKQRKFSLY